MYTGKNIRNTKHEKKYYFFGYLPGHSGKKENEKPKLETKKSIELTNSLHLNNSTYADIKNQIIIKFKIKW